jgi:hypothetical protein
MDEKRCGNCRKHVAPPQDDRMCSSGFVLCSDQPKWRYLSPHRFVCEQHTPMFKGEVLDLADLF